MLEEFLSLWENLPEEIEDKDEPWCTIEQYWGGEEDLELEVLLSFFWSKGVPRQEGLIRCEGLKSHSIAERGGVPILWRIIHGSWPHTKPNGSLYLRGRASNPVELIGALWLTHDKITEGALAFDSIVRTKYSGEDLTLLTLLGGKHGLLAEGPEPLLNSLAEVLEQYGLEPNVVWTPREQAAAPAFWLTIGKSYVVARRFHAERMLEEAPRLQIRSE